MWFAEHPAPLAAHLYLEINSDSTHAFVHLTERTVIGTATSSFDREIKTILAILYLYPWIRACFTNVPPLFMVR